MVEVEEAEGILSVELLGPLAVESDQGRRGVEDPAEVVTDSGPTAKDVTFEAGAAQHLSAAQAVARLEGDPGIVPRGDEHRVESGFGKLETGQIAMQAALRSTIVETCRPTGPSEPKPAPPAARASSSVAMRSGQAIPANFSALIVFSWWSPRRTSAIS